MKKLLIILIFVINIFASETFILPKDKDVFEKKLENLISNAKKSIFISIYNFSSKKLAKEIINAKKRGVEVFVIFDKTKVEEDDKIYKMLKKNKVETKILDDKIKMHIKSMLIDENIVLIGSANYTKKSFEENFELLYISSEESLVNRLKEFRKYFK
ncbi:Phospholipase D precursor [Aliarcobacter thereius]|uniref:phospholipase D n=2 Tax=Aliarcobacter thereius TaxID=544718 RepID=A0A1C0B7C0_9BACT|nr:phospholipase D-like domain-containing protein [Aliarcobacter thereius]OCL86866.1 Phospholipase D precursor [Aliarcobacter thereius]OCL91048.1 Phospholipase D precursor [Aliarcobacter thereius]OCL96098.1 Phospholipase D precursor [Aliarcobacter thereius LMG 24486]OCL99432.1 Phospholipase D precursor [Aliarcobacter thereius]QBF15930.1 nuclease NucT [Aliarcobacter thereius LMG 24486]